MFRIAIAALAVVLLAGCGPGSTNDKLQEQRKESVRTRSATFARAERAVPVPHTTNFPLRKALAKMTARQDLVNHPWYVYILGENGNIIGYYVAQTIPVNACNFLSSTEVVDATDSGKVILTAPSLDGIFYGGGGAAAGCDAWFFFDATTDALVQIRGMNYYAVDQPLNVKAKAIRVSK